MHDLKVYTMVNDASVSHHHDRDNLEVDAFVHRRDSTWMAVEVKLEGSQISEASENLERLEQKMIRRGERPPIAKCIIIGYGMPSHTMSDGISVAPIDALGM